MCDLGVGAGKPANFPRGSTEHKEAERTGTYYLDESPEYHAKHPTAAEPGTFRDAKERCVTRTRGNWALEARMPIDISLYIKYILFYYINIYLVIV